MRAKLTKIPANITTLYHSTAATVYFMQIELPSDGIMPIDRIPGLSEFTGYYVTTQGQVWSTRQKQLKTLSPGTNRGRYLFVYLMGNCGTKRKFYVHQLVALAFIPKGDKDCEVNHINRNGFDNRVINLEWCDRETNIRHANTVPGIIIDQTVMTKVRRLHASLSQDGDFPGLYEFVNALLEGETDRCLQTIATNSQ